MADNALMGTIKVASRALSFAFLVFLAYLCLPLLSSLGEFLFQRLCDVLNFMLITTAVAFGILRSQWKAERKLEAEEEFSAMAALFTTDSAAKSSAALPWPSEVPSKPKMQVKRAEAETEMETETARWNPASAIPADEKRAKQCQPERNTAAALKKTISLDRSGAAVERRRRRSSSSSGNNKAQKLMTRHSCDFSLDLIEASAGEAEVEVEAKEEKTTRNDKPLLLPSSSPPLSPPSPEESADSDTCGAAEDDNQKFEAFIAHFHREMRLQREAN